jgi:hypothetical protein
MRAPQIITAAFPAHARAIGGNSRRISNSAFYRASAADPAFERSKFSQAMIDIAAVFGIGAFILLTAASFVGAFYILLFVGVS